MISKLKKINNIRNFISFSSDEDLTSDSHGESGRIKNAVIYALNGTGKTTISNFLNCFIEGKADNNELNKLLSLEAQKSGKTFDFELEFDGSIRVNPRNNVLPKGQKLFVYNEEFVRRNLDIEDFAGNKEHKGNLIIGTVGADEIKLKKLEGELKSTIESGQNLDNKLQLILSKDLEDFKKTYKARSGPYSMIFTLANLKNESIINEYKKNIGTQNPIRLFKDLEDIDDDFQIKVSPSKLYDLLEYDELGSILTKNFTFEEINEDFEKHVKRVGKEWIETGLQNHENDECPFCRQSTLDLSILKKYQEYIKSEKSKTLSRLTTYRQKIEDILSTISSNKELENTLQEIATNYAKTLAINKKWMEFGGYTNLTQDLNELKDIIEAKEEDLEKNEISNDRIRLLCNSIKGYITEANTNVSQNVETVDEINRKLKHTGTRKTQLRKLIAEQVLINCFDKTKDQRHELKTYERKKQELEVEIRKERAKAQTKEVKKAIIETLNLLLKKIGLNKYEIGDDFILNLKVSTEFDVSRNTHIISQGERTVIAFAYFIAHIIQGLNKYEDLAKSTLIIDDPISSTSYNYLHGIGSALKNLSNLYKRAFQFKGNNANPQLIITTHNIQFYNILHSNVFNKNKCNFYILSSRKSGIQLIKTNNSQKMSEYMTSLSRIKNYVDNVIDDNVGNDLRKVLETICSFHFVDLGPDKIEKIFEGQEINANLKLVADDHIHTDFNNYEDPIDSESLRAASEEVLRLVESKFPGQIQYLNSLK